MYEYANQVAEMGHDVVIYHPFYLPDTNSANLSFAKKLYYKIFSPPQWFKLNKKIKRKLILEVLGQYFEDADVIYYTWWALALEIDKIPASKGIKFNLIQDLEFWNGYEEKIISSYRLPTTYNIAISEHICKFVNKYAVHPVEKISLAIDNNKFNVTKPVNGRNNYAICMMYSEEPRKGSLYGLQALLKAKQKIPGLQIKLFSVYDRPGDLPDYIKFIKDSPRLEEIYNSSAIFISPSLQEGCALPPMEAMICGCAVICTDIDGHGEYSRPGKTTLTAPPKDVDALCEKIIYLVNNNDERVRIALAGNDFMKKHSWQESTRQLVAIWEKVIAKQKTHNLGN